jgi:hypothetical protein
MARRALGGMGLRGRALLGWVFFVFRFYTTGPDAAYYAPTLEMCNAMRETVHDIVTGGGTRVSECKDEDRHYIGVPIQGPRPDEMRREE